MIPELSNWWAEHQEVDRARSEKVQQKLNELEKQRLKLLKELED